MNFVHQLLLNMLIIVTPLMLYQVFWMDRMQRFDEQKNRWIAAFLCTVAALLCMSYPFELSPGFQYDLRLIPLAVCYLYAGTLPTLVVGAIMLAFRWQTGGLGVYASPLTVALVLVILWYAKQRFISPAKLLKLKWSAALGLVFALLTGAVALTVQWMNGAPVTAGHLLFLAVYGLTYVISSVAVMYIARQIWSSLEVKRQTRHTDKMKVLGELAASFAHEIRSPMTVARGFVQMLKQGDLPEDKKQIYNQMVLEEMDRAQKIINEYLSFAKPQFEAIELLNARPLIEKTVHSLQEFASLRQVEIETNLHDNLMISANPDKFAQCILHLCKNGIEAMPGGGKLLIVAALQNQTVSIDIIDHGVGMSEEEVNRLGKPSYATRGRGTGLGMMVTYRAIQNIHGRIDVTSELGKGTCFSIIIPSLHASAYH